MRGTTAAEVHLGEVQSIGAPSSALVGATLARMGAIMQTEPSFAREGVNLETSREAVRATAVRPCVAESDNEQSQGTLHFQRVLQAL